MSANPSLTMRILHDKALIAKLNSLDKQLKFRVSLVALRHAAKPILAAERQLAPVDTGDLRRSLTTKVRNKGPFAYAVIGPAIPEGAHAHLSDRGTQERVQQKTGRRVGRVVGTNWMEKAFNASHTEALARVVQVLRLFFRMRGDA